LLAILAGLDCAAPSRVEAADAAGLTTESVPVITSIRLEGTNVVVVASVPANITKVTVEGCRRLGGEAWTPKAVGRLDGAGGELTFRLAVSPDLALLRVRAEDKETLPDFFFSGPSSFDGQLVGSAGGGSVVADGINATATGGVAWTLASTPFSGQPAQPAQPVQARLVTESDIWEINGDTLYFFNQYRGLQVIDISLPDAPVVRGTLPVAAAGEQMYLLDDTHVVLLARDGCDWGVDAESQVLVVEIKDGKPSNTTRLPVQGTIEESRLVGTALYVASSAYRKLVSTNVADSGQWERGTQIASFDLSQPNQPAARSTQWVSGNGGVVMATDLFLFVAGVRSSDWHTVIRVFDISAPDGTVAAAASTIEPIGEVKDKFKMNLNGDVLTVVSEKREAPTLQTWVETFSLADPAAPQKLGSLKLIEGEALFATRFDGHRLYVVTFRQIDPLWIVDLSDPARPKVAGELQVPGWSTYIHPLGSRLVTIGRDNAAGWRTTVSLFDVQDSAHPALLSRVALGEQYSSSEANSDEKAFGVLPEEGLILVPFSSWTTNGYFQGVQLIDLAPGSLAVRGRIDHEMQARRATAHRDRILSVSGRELLSVNASDRDHPVIRSSTPLVWPVDQVFLAGQFLLELERAGGNSSGPQLRVALTNDPDQVLSRLSLTNLPFLGAVRRGDQLLIVQGRSAQINWQWIAAEQTNIAVSTNFGLFSLTIVDLSQLPTMSVLGQTQFSTSDNLWGSWEALWPKPELLVWKQANLTTPFWGPYQLMSAWSGDGIPSFVNALPVVSIGGGFVSPWLTGGPVGVAAPVFYPWYWGGSPRTLIAFDVSDVTAPKFVSDISVGGEKSRQGTGRGFAADGLVYLSHSEIESETTGTNYYAVTNLVVDTVTNVVTLTNILRIPQYTTVTNQETVANIATVAIVNRADSWQRPASSALTRVLAAGGYHSLLRDRVGTAWAWGANAYGQLGRGAFSTGGEQIETVPDFSGVNSLAAGHYHSLALKSDGTVWAWGADFFGQLGNGATIHLPGIPPLPDIGSPEPVQTMDLSNVVAVAAGGFHSLALQSSGVVWAWGGNWNGQLGDGTTNQQQAPVVVTGLNDVRALAGGCYHSLAVKNDGTVWAWGRNNFGQLGNDATEESHLPALVDGVSGVVAVAGGLWHSLALKADGTVWGWGRDDSGQPGELAAETIRRPSPIAGLSNIVAVTAGFAHNLALKSDGTVWTWGGNDFGELGDGTTNSRSKPAAVEGLNNAMAVAAGDRFSLALTGDGAVWAFGKNESGQLGDGIPVTVTNESLITNFVTVVTYLTVTNYTQRTNYSHVTRQVVVTNAFPIISWLEYHYLDVVDYAVSSNPTVRPPVNIPGTLEGVSHHGALLYTLARRSATQTRNAWEQWLEAVAYDGVEAHLVDSLALTDRSPVPVLVRDATVFLGQPARDTNSTPQLETWTLANSGKFVQLCGLTLGAPAQNLAVFGDLLVTQNAQDLQLFSAGDAARLALIGAGGPAGCVGYNLENADGDAARGLWLPLGIYGVCHLALPQNFSTP
jgi:alpha-tubulin suppressor-like RCC1 family protein